MSITILDERDRTELEEQINKKLNKSGFTPDKYLGTDAEGNIVEKESPESSGGNVNLEGYATEQWVKEQNYLSESDKQEIAEQAAGMVVIPSGGGFVVNDTPPEDTSLLWVDTSDNSGNEGGGGGDENIIPTETVLAEGVVATGASECSRTDTGVTIAMMNQYKRIRIAIKGASNKSNFWCFQFTTQNANAANRIASASGMAITLQRISNGYFRVEAIESRGNADTVLKGLVTQADGWLSAKIGSTSPVILNFTSYAEDTTLKIAPVNATEIDYSWAVCGYNC